MNPKVTEDDGALTCTSASTVSTMNKSLYPHKEKRISPRNYPKSLLRRICWDNCNLENEHRRTLSRKQLSAISRDTGNSGGSGSGSSTNPQESLNGRHNEEDMNESKAIVIGREVFLGFILLIAGLFGYTSYNLLRSSEATLAAQQYVSVTKGALINVRNLAENKLVHGSKLMAKHVGWAYPNADKDWPFVWLPSYWDIMEEVLPTSIWSGVNLAPIVFPHQAESLEEYAYAKIAETFGEDSDIGATSNFGKGIWVKDEKRVRSVDNRYHDTTGIPIYPGSPYHYMAPKLQDGHAFNTDTMMNVHGFETQGLALDAVMNCSIARKENHTKYAVIHGKEEMQYRSEGCIESDGEACAPDPKQVRCSALSGMLTPNNVTDEQGIAVFIATPIYPANDPYDLVGYIFGIVYWVEVMIDIFPKDTIGIDCIFGDPDHEYTFSLENNTATLICEDDCHDTKYDDLMLKTTIVDPKLLSDGSVSYHMTCYPNDNFFETYYTRNPSTAAIGAVGMILFTSILFFCYDYFVRREFRSKKELFEAKRKFVRFVSHEVRTPMNSVCMGLAVLQEEAAMTLGYETPMAMKRKQSTDQNSNGDETTADKVQIEHWFDLANEISANAQASVDVLDDFLNYDKISNGELTLEYTVIPIYDLIQDTVAEFKLPMRKKKITLHTLFPNTDELYKIPINPSHKGGLFCSDDTIQKSNRHASLLEDIDDGISDMEAGCKSDLLEIAQEQKLVGDSVRITQVIRNLVSNAIKFSNEGDDITLSTRFMKSVSNRRKRKATPQKTKNTFELKSKEVITCEKSGEIIFTIKDNGAGLSRAQLKNLFGDGVQFDVNELQSGKGSGLGLYIAKGIVEQHGGSLVGDSDGKGLGCTFTMRLPIYNVPNDTWDSQPLWKRRRPRRKLEYDDEDRDCSLKSLDSRDDGMSELKILLVDDSKSNRKLLDRLMAMRGHRCEQADDGDKGVEMVIKAEQFAQPYDLIFMDYEMPTLNGPEAVKQIRASGSNVFIIGLTGNIMADDVRYFRSCGANTVFPKPFKVVEFELLLQDSLCRDTRGRIIEKGSSFFDMTPMRLSQQDDISPLGLIEEGEITVKFILDDTGISSLASVDQYKADESV